MQKVRAVIHLKSIRENAKAFVKLTGKKVCAVVKANAYGHGAEEVVCALSGVVDCFAVSLIEEGLALKTAALDKEILVLTPPTDEEQILALIRGNLVGSIGSLHTANAFVGVCEKYRLQARVHLKINTGMNRYGMDIPTLGKVCKLLRRAGVRVEGIYSHLYSPRSAEGQRLLFLRACEACRRYYPNAIRHLSATYGCLKGEEFALDMVRVGIGLYGYLPDGLTATETARAQELHLQKGMTVYALNVENRVYRFGGGGYGTPSLPLQKGDCLTLLRVGYGDGFLRKRENGTKGEEHNVNNLCMDVCIRKGKGKRGDWVCLLKDAEAIAKQTGTIAYEVLCAATIRAEFVYEYD